MALPLFAEHWLTEPFRPSRPAAGDSLRVLLVEDDPEDAYLARMCLSRMQVISATVDWVATYEAALAKLARREYDVVLLDHRLGHSNGLELLAEAFGEVVDVPVILLTGEASDLIDAAAARAGVANLIEKAELKPGHLERSLRYAIERTRTERELRATRAFFHAALDALPDHVAIIDHAGVIIEVNSTWERFGRENGYADKDSGRGSNYLEVCEDARADDEDAGRVADGLREMLCGERQTLEVEYRCDSPVEERWFKLTARSFHDGTAPRILIAHKNITADYRAEAELREREERFRALAENSDEMVGIITADGCFTFASKSVGRVLGYSTEELIGRTAAELIHPEDLAPARAALREVARAPGNRVSRRFRLRAKGGELRLVETVLHNLLHVPGLCGIVGNARDITESDRTEARYRRLVETTHEGVWTLDALGNTTFANERLTRMLGYREEEIVGRPVFDFMEEESAFKVRTIFAQWRRQISGVHEVQLRRRDGAIIWALVASSPIVDEVGEFGGVLSMLTDITTRKQAEEELKQSEERYRALFDNNPAPMWLIDEKTFRFLAVNDAAIARYGYSREEFYDRTVRDIHPLEDQPEFDETTERPRELHFSGMTRHEKKSGEIIDVEIAAHNIQLAGRRAYLVMPTDVTDRNRAHHVLRESEERYRLLFDLSPVPKWVVNLDTLEFLGVNQAALSQYGYSRDEFLRMKVSDVVADSSEGEDAIRNCLRNGKLAPTAARHRARSGKEIDVEVSAFDFVFDGKPACLTLVQNVTDRLGTLRSLEASEERYRTLVELSTDGILIHADGRILFANQAAARMRDTDDPSELVGEELFAVVPSEYRPVLVDAMICGGSLPTVEQIWKRPDGSESHMEVTSRPIELAGRPAIQTVFRDVSQRKQLEEQLRQSQKMEAVGRLAGGVAHDFNNLLTVITANTEFLIASHDPSDPRVNDAFEVRKAADRAAALTRQLLAFSRKQILQPRPLDLNEVVKGIHPMLRRLIGEDIEIELALRPAALPVMADPGHLEQVIVNLAVNARDAMPSGGKLRIDTAAVEIKDEIRLSEAGKILPGSYVMLSLTDTGAGMSPDVAARVFEPFFTTKPVGEGTGLGLAVVYGIVKQSGGHIVVDSQPGVGSRFTIFFPERMFGASAIESAAELSQPPSGTETILLVEDEDAVRTVARRILEQKGYNVLVARNGQEAMRAAAEHDGPIHLLLTDVVMPEMSGAAVAERIKGLRPDAAVLYMSGYTDADIVRRGLLKPGAGFVQKPFVSAALLEKVRQTLASRTGTAPAAYT
jgi:two-component system cell cycle sensor histidine kinase/response regulator CckA